MSTLLLHCRPLVQLLETRVNRVLIKNIPGSPFSSIQLKNNPGPHSLKTEQTRKWSKFLAYFYLESHPFLFGRWFFIIETCFWTLDYQVTHICSRRLSIGTVPTAPPPTICFGHVQPTHMMIIAYLQIESIFIQDYIVSEIDILSESLSPTASDVNICVSARSLLGADKATFFKSVRFALCFLGNNGK